MRSAKGSITKLGYNYYRVRVTAKAVNPDTGKPYRLSEYVRGTRRQAEEAKLRLLAESGSEIVDSDTPLSEYVATCYLPDKQAMVESGTFKRKTLTTYKSKLKNYILPTFGSIPIKDISVLAIKKWLARIESRPTARASLAVLSAVLTHAVENMRLRENPCKRVKPPKLDDKMPQVLDLEDIEVYRYFFKGTSIEAAVLLAIGGGFRRGEICGLDVEDIDTATGAVLVDDAYVTDGGEAYTETTKARKVHTVHLPMSVLARLREILPERGPVLPGSSNGRMYPDAVTRAFERVRDKMPPEVPRIPLKNLRHSSHTLAYEVGGDLMGIQDRGGWTSISTPRRFYLRPMGSRDKAIADAMDEALNPGRGTTTVTFTIKGDGLEDF